MNRRRLPTVASVLFAALACCAAIDRCATLASAQQDRGIAVTGSGEVKGLPGQIEFHAKLAGSGEIGGDALVKFQEFKRRSLEAVDGLGLENLKVEFGGFSVTQGGDPNQAYQQMIFLGGDDGSAETAKPEVAISSMFRITVGGIAEMKEEDVLDLSTRLLDKLSDSGVAVLPNQQAPSYDEIGDPYPMPALATFVLADAAALAEQAREQAFASARASAERLAKLAGVKLGGVVSIQEVSSNSATIQYQYDDYGNAYAGAAGGESSTLRVASRTFAPVPVRVSLHVRFALEE